MAASKAAISVALWAVLWEVAARYLNTDFFPPLTAVAGATVSLLNTQSFWSALLETARAFAAGMILAVGVGVPLGVLIGCSTVADKLSNTWINICISAPLTAVVPALIPLLGIGEVTVIATVFLFAVWIIILDTQAGIRRVHGSLVDMSRAFGATGRQIFFLVLLPGALPEILTGVRLGVVRGIKGVIIGQIVVSLLGFGAMFEDFLQGFEMTRFWALILIVFALSFVLVELIAIVERRVEFYAPGR
jgi:NitT/TauT family transport system permease protein